MSTVLVWSDSRGPQMAWVLPDSPEPTALAPQPAYTDGGPWSVPAAMVADKGTNQSWGMWAQFLVGRPLGFSVTVLDTADPWDALVLVRRAAQYEALHSPA